MSKFKSLLQHAAAEARSARLIAEKADAENRDMTAEERSQFDLHFNQATSLKARADQAKADDDVMSVARDLAATVGAPYGVAMGERGSAWAKAAGARVREASARIGVKALTTGSIDVPAVLDPNVVPLPDTPTRLIDLVVDRQTITTNNFSYLRQTVRTNNAAPVPDGGLKPTSVYTFEEVEDRARTVAHLSEPIPERYFADHAEMLRVLEDEMEHGIIEELEQQVTTGDGTGENLTGVLETSGTLAVAFATDLLVTCRKARSALDVLGEVPTAWVFNPDDIEAIDLMREDGATGAFMINESSLANVFGPLPRISSQHVPAGTAILGDWTKTRLYVREESRLDADRSGANFTNNLVVLRSEGRYGFAVQRPQSFAVVDLTAA